jgi:hypothetical protein
VRHARQLATGRLVRPGGNTSRFCSAGHKRGHCSGSALQIYHPLCSRTSGNYWRRCQALLNTGRGAPVLRPRRRLQEFVAHLPGIYDLLPSYRCLDEGGTFRRITPADVQAAGGDAELAAESLTLHETFARPDAARLRTVVGVEQPAVQSLQLTAGVVLPQWHLPAAAPGRAT